MSTPDVESFDEWYRAIDASTRWDPFMQKALGLAPDVQSSGYLTGVGLAEVVERLQVTSGDALVELGPCAGRAEDGHPVFGWDTVRDVDPEPAARPARTRSGRASARRSPCSR